MARLTEHPISRLGPDGSTPICGALALYSVEEIANFWNTVARGDREECWPWMGTTNLVTDYGSIRFLRAGKWRSLYAHRVSWELANGRVIPDGLWACHRCDHPWCVNPYHVFLGTAKQNHDDAVAKGRKLDGGWNTRNVRTHRTHRTHCKYGHPLSGANLAVWGGHRFCRACQARRARLYLHRKRQRAPIPVAQRAFDAVFERVPFVALPIRGEVAS